LDHAKTASLTYIKILRGIHEDQWEANEISIAFEERTGVF